LNETIEFRRASSIALHLRLPKLDKSTTGNSGIVRSANLGQSEDFGTPEPANWANVPARMSSKKVNDIDVSQVKDGDRVICEGSWDKSGLLHASLISKRLSH
jgi:hypothetical protein